MRLSDVKSCPPSRQVVLLCEVVKYITICLINTAENMFPCFCRNSEADTLEFLENHKRTYFVILTFLLIISGPWTNDCINVFMVITRLE